jgi:hypothetical protein
MIEQLGIVLFGWWLSRSDCASRPALPMAPEDDKPEGVDATSIGSTIFIGSSGAKYRVTSFPMQPDKLFHVARAARNADWISYTFDPTTGERSLWRLNAGKLRGADILRRDFTL